MNCLNRVSALLIALVLCVTHVDAQAQGLKSWLGIFGEDEREDAKYNEGWPWVAIGLLTRPDGGHCTATLIDRNRILTAAHCLYSDQGDLFYAEDLLFSAGSHEGKHRAESYARYIEMDQSLLSGYGPVEPPFHQDWAILELERHLYDGGWLSPVPLLGKREAQSYGAEGSHIMQAGYSGDKLSRLTKNLDCPTAGLARNGDILLHRCDATFGDSGSPILVETRQGYAIAAVHVGVVETDDGYTFGAAVIPPSSVRR